MTNADAPASGSGGVRVLRMAGWIRVAAFVAMGLFVAAAWGLYRTEGWSWKTLAMTALVPLAVAGFVDSLVCRVELRPDALVVVHNLWRRTYPRSDFHAVTWSKGVGVALQRSDGGWLVLPDVGGGSPALAAALRAWLAR